MADGSSWLQLWGPFRRHTVCKTCPCLSLPSWGRVGNPKNSLVVSVFHGKGLDPQTAAPRRQSPLPPPSSPHQVHLLEDDREVQTAVRKWDWRGNTYLVLFNFCSTSLGNFLRLFFTFFSLPATITHLNVAQGLGSLDRFFFASVVCTSNSRLKVGESFSLPATLAALRLASEKCLSQFLPSLPSGLKRNLFAG